MILLTANTTSTFCLTLSEKSQIYSTGGTPYFLFQFINDQSLNSKYFIPIYKSWNYQNNTFQLNLNTNENLTGSTLNLQPGYYSYKVYEQTQQYNLDPSLTYSDAIIESGKALVILQSATTSYSYNTTATTQNFVYYN